MKIAQQQKLQLNGRSLPEPAATIWRIIREECQGRENAIRMPVLAARVGVSTRTVQSEIEYLNCEHGKGIGSSCSTKNPGYYMIMDQGDRELTYKNRINRAKSNFRHAAKINKAAAIQEILGQISMVESEE